MAFLDNSGDIILDAVLTDAGRLRLARGDGSFKIQKFCLADDELNYALYNKNHPSGSAYYDLEILQTPILEAITNSNTSIKHKLVSYSRNDLLYMPVIKINPIANGGSCKKSVDSATVGLHVIAVDQQTINKVGTIIEDPGVIHGANPSKRASYIRLDQGLDTNQIGVQTDISDNIETQYTVEMDNRLGTLVSAVGTSVKAPLTLVDSDNIATYFLTSQTAGAFIQKIQPQTQVEILTDATDTEAVLLGPPGTKLTFKIATTLELQTSNYLFTQLGSTSTFRTGETGTNPEFNIRYVDTLIRITGVSTGYQIDVPVRFIKYDSSL